ncbi:unnamed protein product [Toxocara canis]|uniref:COMM domain-containing protein n=1 Tax=Toxocara canis TaxID=6265 RepID=A0A183U1V9_TOXCA|nr:unnamed protein product [Toxocara canis]
MMTFTVFKRLPRPQHLIIDLTEVEIMIADAWRCVRQRTCIERDLHSFDKEQLDKLSHLLELMERLNSLDTSDDPSVLLASSNLSAKFCFNREQIIRLCNEAKEERKDWSVDAVIGSSQIHKSLHLKISLPIGPHLVEMGVDKFGTLRYESFEVARALQRIESYL